MIQLARREVSHTAPKQSRGVQSDGDSRRYAAAVRIIRRLAVVTVTSREDRPPDPARTAAVLRG